MRYTKIHTQIWNDEKFCRLSHSQQRLFLYILTSPHSNIIGFYVLKKTYIQGDLEVLPKDLAKDLAKLCFDGLISYDGDLQVVLIHNWLRHNPITNPNQRLAASKIISELPKTILFEQFKVLCEGLNEVLIKSLPKDIPKPCHPEEEEEEEEGEETEDPKKLVCVFPDWLNIEIWEEFKKYRKEIKSPVTNHGEKLLIADLKKLVDEGQDQTGVINQTIKSGKWKGFYAVKNSQQFGQEPDGPRSKILVAGEDGN